MKGVTGRALLPAIHRSGSWAKNRETGPTAGALLMLLLIPAGAAAHERLLEVLGRPVELPAPVQEAPEKGEKKCEPRSPWLTPMLATGAALQIADAHSTRRAIDAGAQEANPFFRWAVTSDARAYTTKAGMAAFFWWGLDRNACKHPRRGLWTAVALNAFAGLVVRQNYRVGTELLEGR